MNKLRAILTTLTRNPSLSAVVSEGFFARLGFGVITFALPFYALSLGMSITEIGLLASLRLVAAIAVKPLMGWAADRYGKKQVYVWSIAGRCVVGMLFALATTPWALFVVRGLHGVTTAARDPSSSILIAEHADENKMASAFSWYVTAKEIGSALGYLIAGVLLTLTHDHYTTVFLFSVLTSVAALVIVVRYVRNEREPVPVKPNEAAVPDPDLSPNRAWTEYAFLAVMITLTGSMISNLFPIIASQHAGLNKAQISVIFTFSTLAVVFAGPFLGWFADNISRNIVLSLRSVANTLSSVLYMYLPGFAGLTAARLVDDVGKAGFRPAWGSLIAEISALYGKKRRGRVIGYMDTAYSLGEAIGPVLAGLLWDSYGIFWMFAARFGLSLATEIYAVWLMRFRSQPVSVGY